jgi:hypothetical protein
MTVEVFDVAASRPLSTSFGGAQDDMMCTKRKTQKLTLLGFDFCLLTYGIDTLKVPFVTAMESAIK